MAEADTQTIARPEELHRFIRAVLAASDSHTLTMMIAYHGGWIELCRRVLAALAEDPPSNAQLAAACRKAGILPKRLRQCLEPVAAMLGPPAEENRQQDYFEILGVSPKATDDEIRRAYRRRARRLHPDHGGDPRAFIALSTAYQTLSDAEQRRRYEAGGQPTEVDWQPPPPPPEPAARQHSRFPVFIVLLLSLLVAVTFTLEIVQELRTPARPRRSNPVPAHAERTPAGTLALPEIMDRETQGPPIENPGTPDTSIPPADPRDPIEALGRLPADPASVIAPPPAGPVLPAVSETTVPAAPIDRGDHLPRAARGTPGIAPRTEGFRAPPEEQRAAAALPSRLVLVFTPEVDTAATHKLTDFLRQEGYRLSRPTRKTFSGPSSVRFFHAADRPAAAKLHRALRSVLPRLPGGRAAPLSLIDLSRRYPNAPPGLLELWIFAPRIRVAASPAIDPPGRAPARLTAPPQTDARLRAFLDEYCRAYASTDVIQLAALFHDRAQENGRPIQAMLSRYMSDMAQIDRLDYRIELDDYQRPDPLGPFQIAGRFYARVQLTDQQVRESQGPIAMELLTHGQSFLIKSLNYKRDN